MRKGVGGGGFKIELCRGLSSRKVVAGVNRRWWRRVVTFQLWLLKRSRQEGFRGSAACAEVLAEGSLKYSFVEVEVVEQWWLGLIAGGGDVSWHSSYGLGSGAGTKDSKEALYALRCRRREVQNRAM